MRMFMPIHKTEELSDGTLLVTGIASTESVDSDGETISAEAMKAALPDFFKYGTGNLREMHQLSAAGTVDKADVSDGITYIETTVVDPVAVKKVKAGVYKGFSIGGSASARDKLNKKLITGVRLSEISLVDRPANPEAVIQMYKADEITEEPTVHNTEPAADPTALEKAAIDAIAGLLNKGTIKASQLLKAAQDVISPPAVEPAAESAAPVVEKAAKLEGDALKKGMSELCNFAGLLCQVSWLTMDAEWEAQIEGDGSTLPAQLREWLAQGASIFAAMTTEELAEMLSHVQLNAKAAKAETPAGDAVAKSEPAPAPPAEPATATEPPVVGQAPAVEAAPDADQPAAKAEEPAGEDPLVKAEALTKAMQADLQKALGAIESLTTDLQKANQRIDAMSRMAAPGKALLKAIGKGDDVSGLQSEPSVAPVIKADGSKDDAATLIKAAHASGGRSIGYQQLPG